MASTQTTVLSALVLYASETGNGEDLAYEIGRMCERLGFAATVQTFDSAKIVRLASVHRS
jgi:sulfite reductase alpha subunit-like flavoprotein